MSDNRGPYLVYRLNRLVRTFTNRDDAAAYVWAQRCPEDHEILDRSDQ